MYWSGDQSTGAEIKKYLTGSVSVRVRASIEACGQEERMEAPATTYDCRLAAEQLSSLLASSVEHPDRGGRSPGLPNDPEVCRP